jgi:hypothetical protein
MVVTEVNGDYWTDTNRKRSKHPFRLSKSIIHDYKQDNISEVKVQNADYGQRTKRILSPAHSPTFVCLVASFSRATRVFKNSFSNGEE